MGFSALLAVAFMAEQFRTRLEQTGLENQHQATTPVLGRGLEHPSLDSGLQLLASTAVNLSWELVNHKPDKETLPETKSSCS